MAIEDGTQLATSIGGVRPFGTCPQPCEHQICFKQAAESVHTIQEKLVAQDSESGGHLVRLVPLFLWQTCMHITHCMAPTNCHISSSLPFLLYLQLRRMHR
jgi:hypothetical protein